MPGRRGWAAAGLLLVMVGPGSVQAQDGLTVSGGFTMVGQWIREPGVRSEVVGSVDLFATLPVGEGVLVAYVEANSTPFRRGVSTRISEANSDAGTALNVRRGGRVQLSELKLEWPVATDTRLTLGLLDVTGSIDVSRISNDENLHFLGVGFVNNPAIDFPDYTLGGILERSVDDGLGFALVAAGSHGLADNPGVSYDELLQVDQTEKGLFLAGALRWHGGDRRASLGVWMDTGEHERLDGRPGGEVNKGVYALLGQTWGRHGVNLRMGLADPDVFLARGFAGLTYLWVRRPMAVGVATGYTWASPVGAGPERDDVAHLEGFVRGRLWRDLFITASGQVIRNSDFETSDPDHGRTVVVPGVRLSFVF